MRKHGSIEKLRSVRTLQVQGAYDSTGLSNMVAPQGPGVHIPGCFMKKDLPLATRYYHVHSCIPTRAGKQASHGGAGVACAGVMNCYIHPYVTYILPYINTCEGNC